MSFHLAQLNLDESQSNHNLNNWPASQGRRPEYFTARAITGGTTNMGDLARPIIPTDHLLSERYPMFVRNNTDYSTSTPYPQTNNGYVGNSASFMNSTNQYTASEASYSSKSSTNYFNRSYVKANNEYATNRAFSANKSDYGSNGGFNTSSGEHATTNGSFTRSDYSSSRAYSRVYNEYATYSPFGGNSAGYTMDKATSGYSAAGYSQPLNNDVQSDSPGAPGAPGAPGFPRNNNVYQTSGDLGRNNFDYPKTATSLPSFSTNTNDEGFSYYSKNTGLNSPYGNYTVFGNGRSTSYEPQSAKPQAKKVTSQGGNQNNKSAVYASHSLYGAPILQEDEDLDTTETLSPAESETSGVSSFSGLSSHCSYYTRPDDSFMKLRFKNEKPVIMHENRNILDLGSNVKPFGGFFTSTPLPEASKTSESGLSNQESFKSKPQYDRTEEVRSSPDLPVAEPCHKCGYVMVQK